MVFRTVVLRATALRLRAATVGVCASCFSTFARAAQGPGVGAGSATPWEQAAAPLLALAFLLVVVALSWRDRRQTRH